eukprot:scaffold25273_cov101-Isochrysis_galbana.AAC.2
MLAAVAALGVAGLGRARRWLGGEAGKQGGCAAAARRCRSSSSCLRRLRGHTGRSGGTDWLCCGPPAVLCRCP